MVRLPILVLLGLCCLLAATPGFAASGDRDSKKPETKVTGHLSRDVYEQIKQANNAIDADKLDQAEAIMAGLMDNPESLTIYEKSQVFNFLSVIHFKQGHIDAAIQDYRQILQLNKKKVPRSLRINAIYRLAQLYASRDQFETALKLLNHWFNQVDDVRPDAYMLKAQIAFQMGDYHAAKKTALKALREATSRGLPPKEHSLALLRAVYYKLEDYSSAARLLELMIKRYPDPSYYRQLAGMYGLMDKQKQQLAILHAAYVAGLLNNGSAILNLARLYMANGAPYPAIDVIKDALRNGKAEVTAETLQLLAQAMTLAKHDKGQIKVLKKAASLSGDAKQYVYLGQAYVSQYQWADAARALEKALNIGGLASPGMIHMQLGTAYYNLENYNRARNAFQQAARHGRLDDQAQKWLKFVNQAAERADAIQE